MKSTRLLSIAAALLVAGAARAQLADDFNAPPANCCLLNTAKSLADQLQDWNQLGRYYGANRELKKQPADPKRVVFMGDSITDGWHLDEYFGFPGKYSAGISTSISPESRT